jgi:hypothetical protein
VQGTLPMEMAGQLDKLRWEVNFVVVPGAVDQFHTNSVLFLNSTFGTECDECNGSRLLRNWTFEVTQYVFHDYLICAFVAIRIRRIH